MASQTPQQDLNFNNISTATTTVVKSGKGNLHSITVNTTAAATITIYDNTAASGTTIGTMVASIAEGTYEYNIRFNTGLTILTGGASDITVNFS